MSWIFDHFQIVVFVLLIVGSVVKSLIETKAKSAVPDQSPRLPGSPQQGMPSAPPPLVQDDSHSPWPVAAAEAAHEMSQALKHQKDLAERLLQLHERKAVTTGDAVATRARLVAQKQKTPSLQSPPTLRRRLRDRGEVRRAVVMREILDSPVSLR